MIDTMSDALSLTDKRDEKLFKALERLYSAAQPGAVYGEPVLSGNYTVITASEVATGGGFGSWIGLGPTMSPTTKRMDKEMPQSQQTISGMSGGGGGGGSSGRPVAIITIGPEGVTVKPVFDMTKIALAGLTALGAMVVMFRKMLKASRS